ncbi:hypothetical protein MPLB_920026 [Mesorhizobium sp. ORS 3324]|nr:hypothetical protein MPLB_920026 [Mesorhizobium sp. ORS 3324]
MFPVWEMACRPVHPPCYENSILGPRRVMLGSPYPRVRRQRRGSERGRDPAISYGYRTELLNHCEACRVSGGWPQGRNHQ